MTCFLLLVVLLLIGCGVIFYFCKLRGFDFLPKIKRKPKRDQFTKMLEESGEYYEAEIHNLQMEERELLQGLVKYEKASGRVFNHESGLFEDKKKPTKGKK